MLKVCKNNKEKVLEGIRTGNINAADVGFSNLIDEIVLKMKNAGLLDIFKDVFEDKRSSRNSRIPLNMFFTLAATAKIKLRTSLTDIPYAITDPDTLLELGWNIYEKKGI